MLKRRARRPVCGSVPPAEPLPDEPATASDNPNVGAGPSDALRMPFEGRAGHGEGCSRVDDPAEAWMRRVWAIGIGVVLVAGAVASSGGQLSACVDFGHRRGRLRC